VNGNNNRAGSSPKAGDGLATAVEDAANRKFRTNSRGEPKLAGQVKLYATPTAGCATGSSGGGQTRDLRTDVGGQLNPTWVEWLMGFPLGWTDLDA
jgi:hypothetical protein